MKEEREIVLENREASEVFFLELNRRLGSRKLVMRLKGADRISISAPMRVSLREVEDFVRSHAAWVFAERENFSKSKSLREYFSQTPRLWSGGREFFVNLHETAGKSYWLEDAERGEIVFAFKDDADFKKLFLKYAKESVGRILATAASSRGIKADRFSIRDQRGRWASRSTTGMLSFNWRIALLPAQYQEYVILHELAHEKFMDHSVSFWIYLSRLCENAKSLDRRLAKDSSEIFMVERQ